MKPKKTLLSITMLALFVSVVFIACQKDGSIENSATGSDAVSADRYGGGNKSPIAKAGADQTITLPVSSVNFDGTSSSDPDGTIKTYTWTKEIGTGGTITSASSAKTSVTGLTAGNYRFKLTVKDNGGATASDTVHVTVKGTGSATTPPANQPPVITIGAAQTITLPVSSVTLSGSATDPNGTIASYLWTKVSGGTAVIVTPNAASTSVTGLIAGSYVFNLKATDNAGASSNKTVAVTVNASGSTPPPAAGGTNGYNTLVYSNGFDNASSINSNQLGSGGLSTSVFKSGTGSFKSLVTAGEGQISSGWRSEQQYPESYSPMGAEIAVEYDELFESLPNVQGLSTQWHGNVSGTSGETSLWINGGKFMVQRNVCGTAGCPNIFQTGNLQSIQTNRWYHLRWEIKFSAGSDGYERLYIDGVLYYSATGKTSDGGGQYLKIGQNLFASPGNNSVMYFDNLQIWKK